MIGFDLTGEQNELLTEVRTAMEEEVLPHLVEVDKQGDDTLDLRLAGVLASLNLIAPIIPREYGGRGLDYVSAALIIEEIAAANPGLAAYVATAVHAVNPILLAGSRQQKEKFLPLLTSGNPALASFALTEPKGGSDLENMETTVARTPDGFRVTGTKDYVIAGAKAAFITMGVRQWGRADKSALGFLIVPGGKARVTAVRNKMGIRYAHTVQLRFDDVSLPEECGLGLDGSGYLLLTQTLDYGRALVGALEVGIARGAYQQALDFARNRSQFGRPIINNQGISFPLAEIATHIDAARLMVWRACWLIDQGCDCSREASMAKLFASEVARQSTSACLDILGARGYMSDHPINVYFRDARAGAIVEGTNNIQKMLIASLL